MTSRSIIPRLGAGAQKQIREKLGKEVVPNTAGRTSKPPHKTTAPSSNVVSGPRLAVQFDMPIPPSVNHLFADGRTRRVKSSAYRAWWDAALKELVYVQKVPRVWGEVALFLRVHRPTSTSDISNRIKSAEDLLVAARVIDDDRFVAEIHASWDNTVATCRVRIEPR